MISVLHHELEDEVENNVQRNEMNGIDYTAFSADCMARTKVNLSRTSFNGEAQHNLVIETKPLKRNI